MNGNIAPLARKLSNGDTVTIITSPHQTPSSYWLDIVKTTKASSKIRSWFKKATLEQSISLGEDLLERELKRLRIKRKISEDLEALAKEYGLPDVESALRRDRPWRDIRGHPDCPAAASR